MGFHRFEEMTWIEVAALDKTKSIVFLPLSPIEEHGPHLPLGTDFMAARDIAEAACRIVLEEDPRLETILMPVIPLGCSATTADFPGTISLRGSTLARVVEDVCESMARAGFRYIVISNHHLDPMHIKAILAAIEVVQSRHAVRIIETAGRIHYSGIQTQEADMVRGMGLVPQTEIHADVKETSFVKARYPSLVKGNPESMAPVLVNIEQAIKEGRDTFKAMGAEGGYIGSPAMAKEELGRLHLQEGAQSVAGMALGLIRSQDLPEISDRMKHMLERYVRLT